MSEFQKHWRATKPSDREAAFQSYLEASEPYFAKVAENGEQPWFSSPEERRELFYRRYKTHEETHA